MLFAVRIGERYRPTRDLDLLGMGEATEASVKRAISNSRMKDFTDVAMAARRLRFSGDSLVAALRATFRRRGTEFPEQMVGLSERFLEDANAQANWKAFASRSHPTDFQSLAQVVAELRLFLQEPLDHARTGESFRKIWNPNGPWI
ncbi:MAG: nucleotidyl transferase AbiEii/AbiGii toxin family protein [Cyanobacteria bacterium]|nr:nucleotidyl transferase AbiEii/AbiGii toxin family protein [Cyanobacteriota bacterium]